MRHFSVGINVEQAPPDVFGCIDLMEDEALPTLHAQIQNNLVEIAIDSEISFDEISDSLSYIYQNIFQSDLRHFLGEYYRQGG